VPQVDGVQAKAGLPEVAVQGGQLVLQQDGFQVEPRSPGIGPVAEARGARGRPQEQIQGPGQQGVVPGEELEVLPGQGRAGGRR